MVIFMIKEAGLGSISPSVQLGMQGLSVLQIPVGGNDPWGMNVAKYD